MTRLGGIRTIAILTVFAVILAHRHKRRESVQHPRDDLGDGYGLDPTVPAGLSLSRRAGEMRTTLPGTPVVFFSRINNEGRN